MHVTACTMCCVMVVYCNASQCTPWWQAQAGAASAGHIGKKHAHSPFNQSYFVLNLDSRLHSALCTLLP